MPVEEPTNALVLLLLQVPPLVVSVSVVVLPVQRPVAPLIVDIELVVIV